jgi:succinate dehydrogenase hydrophobic anchor subunit
MEISLLPLARWIESTPLGVTMNTSHVVFPVVLIAHIIGLTLFIGTILIADLNLLGIGMRRQPVSGIARQLLPVTVAGLAVALISGPVLFVPQAVKCYESPFFRIKMLLLLLALAFHFTIHRRATAQDEPRSTAVSRKLIACVSLMLWVSVGVAGQAIGLLGSDVQ